MKNGLSGFLRSGSVILDDYTSERDAKETHEEIGSPCR